MPNQFYPEKMLKIVSNSVKEGGIFITTTHSPLSLLPEKFVEAHENKNI